MKSTNNSAKAPIVNRLPIGLATASKEEASDREGGGTCDATSPQGVKLAAGVGGGPARPSRQTQMRSVKRFDIAATRVTPRSRCVKPKAARRPCRCDGARAMRRRAAIVRPMLARLLIGCSLVAGCIAPPPASNDAARPDDTRKAAQALLWSARSPGRVYRKHEVRAFEFKQAGHRIGRSWGRYAGLVDGDAKHHRFETRIELEIPGRPPVRSVGELVLDARGRLVRGYERSSAAELQFERQGKLLRITDGSQVDEIGYDPDAHDVAVMAHSAILHEELMLALRTIRRGALKFRLLSLSGSPPTEWEADVEPMAGAIHLRTSLGEDIMFRDGRILEVRVSSADLQIEPIDETWPTWEVEGPTRLTYEKPPDAAFDVRAVELPGRTGEPALHGEVLVPKHGERPFPAVLWISSTGREDRYGFAGPPAVDLGSHEITDALANAGFVVLRFDERGHGKSEAAEATFLGQVEDARRGLRTLIVQDEVDPDRVVIVGHGEGGLRALHVAAGTQGIRGVALLAVPGRPYGEVFRQQAEAGLRELPPAMQKQARQQQQLMLEAIVERGEVPPELEAQKKWILEMLEQKPDRLIAQVDAPLLIAQGGKDFEIDPRTDVAALVRAAKKHGKRHEVKRYADLDHLFKYEGGESMPSRYLEDRRVDKRFIADLVQWATKRAH
jgi:pimeloyl-ACP methyl ester carboxylesterase